MASDAFCPKCGQNTDGLPTRGFGAPETACTNLDCPNVHPYVLGQQVRTLLQRYAGLQERIERLERLAQELADKRLVDLP